MPLTKRIAPILATLVATSMLPAGAQNLQNWLNNVTNKIQQDASSGLINQTQATNLQNRASQIQSQEQQYLNQNGGTLTTGEQAQIGSELRRLGQHTRRDVRQDNPNLYPNNGYVPPGVLPPGAPVPSQWQGWNGWNPNTANVPPQYQTNNGNPYRHHHHHHYDGNNGQYNQNNGQYWGH